MSFQAYIDNIKQKTGKSPEDFKKLAEEKGLLEESVKARQIIDWLKQDFDLGHGHAMAIVTSFQSNPDSDPNTEEKIGAHFAGSKERWRPVFDELLRQVNTFGDDIDLKGGGTYITFLRQDKKFAIIVIGTAHLDIGIKLKGVDPTDRFAVSGKWNAMVTHRVRLTSQDEVDTELIEWLRRAYIEGRPVR